MWIVDDDGDMFNTDLYIKCKIVKGILEPHLHHIILIRQNKEYERFQLHSTNNEERLTRYYDLVEKLTGERIDG